MSTPNPNLTAQTLDSAVHSPDIVRALITRYQEQLDVPDETATFAEGLFTTRFADNDNPPGRGYEVTVAAALAVACDTHDIPRTLDDFVDASDAVDQTAIPRFQTPTPGVGKSDLRKEKQAVMRSSGHTTLQPDADVFLERYLDDLDISSADTRDAARTALDDVETVRPNIGPSQKAAIAIELATHDQDRPKQHTIAAATATSEVTLRSRRKEVQDEIDTVA